MRSVSLLLIGATALASTPASADDEAEPEEHEHHHMNHVAIFIGATTGLGEGGSTHLTLGAEYERRLPFAHMVGVGALIDSEIASETETLIAGFVAIHPIAGLMVLGAVGGAMTGFARDGHLGLRAGAAYFVPVGELAIGPAVSFDHIAGENALVYGISAGAGF